MTKVFELKETHVPADGKTLADIVADKCPTVSWQEFALFNWGTDRHAEVNRMLVEVYGAKEVDAADCTKAKIEYARAPAGTLRDMRIPKPVIRTDLALTKKHKLKLREVLPPTAVAITALDRWFIPGVEECAIGYGLEGALACADKVEVEVYGSNYCACTSWSDGLGKYTALPDSPVFKQLQANDATPRTRHTFQATAKTGNAPWKGQANAADGILAQKKAKTERFINAAFSPYTVLVRYYPARKAKDAGFAKARIVLHPFWPAFDPVTRKVKAGDASLKVRWEVKNTSHLDQGLLQIWDLNGRVVFQRPIPKADLGAGGEKNFVWDGVYNLPQTDGQTEAALDRMPYRVQIQAHSGPDKDDGLGLATMHTEVRIFVHPRTRPPDDRDYEPSELLIAATPGDPQSLRLSLAPPYLGDDPPVKKTGLEWVQYELARNGFHPGPVDGVDRKSLEYAVKEFQRSVPKKHKAGAKFERLKIDGIPGDNTKDALSELGVAFAAYRRACFGRNNATRSDYAQATEGDLATIGSDLSDVTKEMIVWVDWRHSYTKSDSDQSMVKVDDYRGSMDKGDQVATDDEKIVGRPCLPLRTSLQLLGRGQQLTDTPALETDEARLAAMRQAIGPLRLDWTFSEPGSDVTPIATAPHVKERVRTKRYVEWVLDNKKATHAHKNPQRSVTFTNAPATEGGIRPAAPADYYKAVYGHENKEWLRPWKPVADAATESIATVVHDRLSATQGKGADLLDEKSIGYAGVNFRPSTIGGDGYRLRVQLRLKKCAGYEFPNLEVLEKRYPRLPQACSAKLRVWRRSSFRARLGWGSGTNHFNEVAQLYASGHVHFVHELGTAASYAPVALVGTDVNGYKKVITDRVPNAFHKQNAKIGLSDNYAYPWWDQPNLGWPVASPPNIPWNQVVDDLIDPCENNSWAQFQEALLLDMARRIEEKDGRLRGHILAPFTPTRDVYAQKYECQSCAVHFWYIEKDATGGAAAGFECESCGEKGKKGIQPAGECDGNYECSQCHALTALADWYPAGGKHVGGTGACTHAGKLVLNSVTTTTPHPVPRKTRTIVNYGIGNPAGVIWVPGGMVGWEWAHEIGHNRHLEHSADAPTGGRDAQRTALHDSENNTIGAWKSAQHTCDQGCGNKTLAPAGAAAPQCATCGCDTTAIRQEDTCPDGHAFMVAAGTAPGACPTCAKAQATTQVEYDCDQGCGNVELREAAAALDPCPSCGHGRVTNAGARADALNRQWDRACIMSYVDATDDYDRVKDVTYFCGKCVLRARGWKVEGVAGGPGPAVTVP